MNATTEQKEKIAITGNTYPVKEQLKALGAKWNADQKAWMVSADKAEEAQKIVAGAPAKTAGESKPAFRHYRCTMCGCSASRYNPIYRSGLCKSCWLGEKEEREMGY